MNTKNILVVEDDEDMIMLMEDALECWNENNKINGRIFNAIYAKSSKEADQVLFDMKIDGALIDLRLPSDDCTEKENSENGNRLADAMLNENGIPIAIVSGNTREVDRDRLSDLVKAFDKVDDGYNQAVKWLANQWELMDALRSVRKKLEQSTAEVFVRRIWRNWSKITDTIGHDDHKLATLIARQYASHTAEFLSQDDDWHPSENFIMPSYIADRAHTGDIFELEENDFWVVLTPQCDMSTRRIPNVLLAKCLLGLDEWQEKRRVKKSGGNASNNQRKKADNFFKELVNQNRSPSEHFLPPIPGEDDPLLVKFNEIRTIPLNELEKNLGKRVASVSPPFLGNLIQRFGAFISRTGQPNINIEHL